MEKIILPEGYWLYEKDGWFQLVENGKEPIDFENEYCYFCEFSEIKPTLHHIIMRCDGGNEARDNLLPLCPNHHSLIHRKKYVLKFSKGFYYLEKIKGKGIIEPTERQSKTKRNFPIKKDG